MDLVVGRSDVDGTPWSVLSDLAITMVLVFVVYLVLQFVVTFRERFINTELAKRQREIRTALLGAVDSGLVQIDSVAPDRQKLTFRSEALFEVCKAALRPQGAALLNRVGRVLGHQQELLEAVQVEGHTDIVPTGGRGCPYPTNWELSSARATSVVSLFSALGTIANAKLSATGRAEFHPVDRSNLAPNRRIELLLQYDRSEIARRLADRERAAPRP
jgi:flagellar motor protein MotB